MDTAPSPEVIQIGSKAQASMPCAGCGQITLPGEFYSYRGKDGADVYLCRTCRTQAEGTLKAETENPNMVSAILVGALAAVASAAAWYWITIITKMEIGYVAIGVGYVIGMAVMYGAGHKRGPQLQMLSAGLALAAIYGAKYFLLMHFVHQYLVKERNYTGPMPFLSPFNPAMLHSIVSPMGLLIWGIALYVAFRTPQSRSL
jgi:hypothetical protein